VVGSFHISVWQCKQAFRSSLATVTYAVGDMLVSCFGTETLGDFCTTKEVNCELISYTDALAP